MGRVFFDIRKRIINVDAAYTVKTGDSGSIFMINQGSGYAIDLPNAADAQEGWYAKFVIGTVAAAAVTIEATDSDGDNMYFQCHSLDGTDRQTAGADVLTFINGAEKGDMFDIYTDGTSWYINGWVADDGHLTCA